MKISLKSKDFIVIDNLISESDFKQLVNEFQKEAFHSLEPEASRTLFRYTGQSPLKGPVYKKIPAKHYLRAVYEAFLKVAEEFSDYLTATPRFDMIPYMYPAGNKLNWHADGGYGGAFTYFCHPVWLPTWGGELLISGGKPVQKGMVQADINGHLLEAAHGIYIQPKPNRLVVLKSGIFHSVSRIDPDAGDNMRCSVVAFIDK